MEGKRELGDGINSAFALNSDTIKSLIKSYGSNSVLRTIEAMFMYPRYKENNLNKTGSTKHCFCASVAHYIFRNGPVEDMHADGKLSEKDMEVLNKFMMNRLGELYDLFVLDKINSEKGMQTIRELLFYYNSGYDWDNIDVRPLDAGSDYEYNRVYGIEKSEEQE